MNVAIIVAAGRGARMNDAAGVPKQFRLLAGVPLVIHTLRRFETAASVDATLLVVAAEVRGQIENLIADYTLDKLHGVIAGAATRARSVQNGLEALAREDVGIVAIHDAARPFVMPEEIDRVMAAAAATGAAILAVPATDTIKEVAGNCIARTPPRHTLYHALTPQCFRYQMLHEAYRTAQRNGTLDTDFATDDSQLVERLGISVNIVEGSRRNIKITRPEDWAIAERMIEGVTGNG